jgi:hypothetical protein
MNKRVGFSNVEIMVVVGFVVLVCITLFAFLGVRPNENDEHAVVSTNFTESFQDELTRVGVERVGQPIEGFSAQIYLEAFPALTEEDFDGVQTLEGAYVYEDGALSLSRTEGQPVSSAEEMISDLGYQTLLSNLSSRLGVPVKSESDLRTVLEKIERNDVAPDNPPATITPLPVACTQEAKICPDGSAVGRTGPNCEFASCPSIAPTPTLECTKDSDCPSSKYMCQEIMGTGTACPDGDSSCVPAHTIVQGACKLKEGSECSADSDCVAGNLCNANICKSPIANQCSGPNDTSCATGYECVRGCGSPVGYEGEPPPSYFCQLKGYIRNCPICLAKDTLIDTPRGAVSVQSMEVGTSVWTVNEFGERVQGVVTEVSEVPVPDTHQMVALVLSDGRTVRVSPGHPTVDGRTAGELSAGDLYEGSFVVTSDRVSYGDGATYDILPSGATGFYWANDILLDSTLHERRR